MDNIFFPDVRRWISPPTFIGASTAELKNLVKLNKKSLLIIDPTEGDQTDGQGFTVDVDADKPEYMVVNHENDVETHAERLRERLETNRKNKWAEGDDACEALVEAAGGAAFFNLRERKPAQKKRGRQKAKNSEEDMEEDGNLKDEAEDSQEACPSTSENCNDDSLNPGTTEENGNGAANIGFGNSTINLNSNIYEQFNYFGLNNPTDDSILDSPSRFGFDDKEELDKISQMIPEGLESSDNENMDEFEFDDRFGNYPSLAAKIDQYKGMIDSDELDSADENEQAEALDVEEDAPENKLSSSDIDVDTADNQSPDNDSPGPSSILVKSGVASQRKTSRGQKNKRVTLNIPVKNKGSAQQKNQNLQLVPTKKKQTPFEAEDPPGSGENKEEESVANFKRFVDWVCNKTHEKEKERLKLRRPELMKALNLKEQVVTEMQKNTSAFLTTTKGEVFQDDPILKSSSMPLLAPPVVNPSARSLQSLAVFLTHGEDPSFFPWKSVNVQQQINDDFVYDEFVKRMDQQKVDAANPAMKNELVDKEEDLLIQLLIYQASDPEDVLPDEVKLRRRADDDAESVMALGTGRKKDGDGNGVGGQNRYVEPKLAYELHLLGSQTVGDLMNAIHCENDYVYLQDVPHPHQYVEDPRHWAKKKYPSSMILIHETVYCDPNTSEMDYVSVINRFAEIPPRKRIGRFKRGNLNTKLKDLEVRFGSPYVYIHLGGCEHIFVFTKARLLHLEDDHLKKNYPKVIGMTKFKNIYCRVDNEYLARWAVVGFKDWPIYFKRR